MPNFSRGAVLKTWKKGLLSIDDILRTMPHADIQLFSTKWLSKAPKHDPATVYFCTFQMVWETSEVSGTAIYVILVSAKSRVPPAMIFKHRTFTIPDMSDVAPIRQKSCHLPTARVFLTRNRYCREHSSSKKKSSGINLYCFL